MKRRNRASVRRLQLESLELRRLLAGDLQITELNYNPHPALPQFGERPVEDPDEFEFLEVTNVGDQPLNLDGYRFTAGIEFVFDRQFLNAGERLVIVKDKGVFKTRFGEDVRLADGDDGDGGKNGEYGGKLANEGELLELRDRLGNIVDQFHFYDRGEWPRRADGQGSSLERIAGASDGNNPKSWRASSEFGGSPGEAGEGFRGDVVINELLTHTDLPQVDAIELHNRTSQPINMEGWYVSDSATNLFRFQITGTKAVINPGDYQTFDETEMKFGFRGQAWDNAFLVQPDSTGKPLRFVDAVTYGATQNGVTLGRWSNGQGELFPMTELTFDDANSGPEISGVIISELQYHPADPPPGSLLSEDDLEYIEIYNRTGTPLNIEGWRLSDNVMNEVDLDNDLNESLYIFPSGTTIPAGQVLLVLGFNPRTSPAKTREFLDYYKIPDSIPLFGPYSDAAYDPNPDQLDNEGETVLLERPEDPQQYGLGFVLEDRVIYSNKSPWPEEAGGTGRSLTRVYRNRYGDFPENWQAALPSPGRPWLPGDVNGDGLVNATDIDMTCLAAGVGGQNQVIIYDHNRDEQVNDADVEFLVHDILDTTIGDANLDGNFDTADFVLVLMAGEYEDGIPNNSGWAEGDWNCDQEFDTGDLVAALQTGAYESNVPRAVAAPTIDRGLIGAAVESSSLEGTQADVDDRLTGLSTPPQADSVAPVAVELEPLSARDAIFAQSVDLPDADDSILDPETADLVALGVL